MKIKVQATKMVNADATYISLVNRGANRIPFKIIKQEKPMANKGLAGLDLGSIFARKAEKVEAAAIVGIATMNGDGLELISKSLEEAGFDVSNMLEMEDGSVVYKQSDDELDGDNTIIKLSDTLAVITKGFSPYSMEMDYGTGDSGLSFSDAVAAQGFYPGLNTVIEVMRTSVGNILREASSPTKAATDIASLFDEAKKYTMSFINSLPVKAFKLDSIAEAYKTEDNGLEGDAAGEENESEGEEGDAGDPDSLITKTEADMAATTETVFKDDEGNEILLSEIEQIVKAAMSDDEKTYMDSLSGKDKIKFMKGSSEVRATMMKPADDAAGDKATKSDDQDLAEMITTQMATMLSTITQKMDEALAAVTAKADEQMAQMATQLEDMTTRVEGAESVAKAAKEAVSGTVVPGSESGDAEAAPVAKQEVVQGSFGGREIDTAFLVRKKNNGRNR